VPVPAELRQLACELWFVIPPPPRANRQTTDRYVLHMPENRKVPFTSAGRLRLGDGDVEEIRERFRAAGRDFLTWWVSPDATPAGLAERLVADGAVPLESPLVEAQLEAMVMADEPAPPPADVVARVIVDAKEYALASEIIWEGEDVPEPERERYRPQLPEFYEQRHLSGQSTTYLAWLDGEPVATASAWFGAGGAALNGAVTGPAARGRGAYSALVHARWRDARDRGLCGLATQAQAMSAPILARRGFESLGQVRLLYDRLA
jgi:hypothetical protein